MTRKLLILLAIPALAACAANTGQTAPALPVATPTTLENVRGLDIVMNKTAGHLIRLFGRPKLDVAEPPARKLQFSSGACIWTPIFTRHRAAVNSALPTSIRGATMVLKSTVYPASMR